MNHSHIGPRHCYRTDMRPMADLLVHRLMDRGYWFEVSRSVGVYTVICGVDPVYLNDQLKISVEGFMKGNYKRKAA